MILTFLLGVYVGAEAMALIFLWAWFTGRFDSPTDIQEEK